MDAVCTARIRDFLALPWEGARWLQWIDAGTKKQVHVNVDVDGSACRLHSVAVEGGIVDDALYFRMMRDHMTETGCDLEVAMKDAAFFSKVAAQEDPAAVTPLVRQLLRELPGSSALPSADYTWCHVNVKGGADVCPLALVERHKPEGRGLLGRIESEAQIDRVSGKLVDGWYTLSRTLIPGDF